MSRLYPVNPKKFEKFLRKIGCEFVRQKGDHKVYYKKGLTRPVIFSSKKNVPVFAIKNNLRTLKIDIKDYLKLI